MVVVEDPAAYGEFRPFVSTLNLKRIFAPIVNSVLELVS